MAKQLNANKEPSKKKLMTKGAFLGMGPGYKKRRFGLLSNEIDAKADIYDKGGKISKSSEIK